MVFIGGGAPNGVRLVIAKSSYFNPSPVISLHFCIHVCLCLIEVCGFGLEMGQ